VVESIHPASGRRILTWDLRITNLAPLPLHHAASLTSSPLVHFLLLHFHWQKYKISHCGRECKCSCITTIPWIYGINLHLGNERKIDTMKKIQNIDQTSNIWTHGMKDQSFQPAIPSETNAVVSVFYHLCFGWFERNFSHDPISGVILSKILNPQMYSRWPFFELHGWDFPLERTLTYHGKHSLFAGANSP